MAEIEKIAVYDARIIQDPPKYAVQKGALSVSTSQFQANAANSSQLSFQVLVPSLNVFTDRKVELNASAYVYAEAVPTQIVEQYGAVTVPIAIDAGQYIQGPGTQAQTYTIQDDPIPATYPSNGSSFLSGNTACVLPANSWPGLAGSSSQSQSVSPTPLPALQWTYDAGGAQQAALPGALPMMEINNPFLQTSWKSVVGTFQCDVNLEATQTQPAQLNVQGEGFTFDRGNVRSDQPNQGFTTVRNQFLDFRISKADTPKFFNGQTIRIAGVQAPNEMVNGTYVISSINTTQNPTADFLHCMTDYTDSRDPPLNFPQSLFTGTVEIYYNPEMGYAFQQTYANFVKLELYDSSLATNPTIAETTLNCLTYWESGDLIVPWGAGSWKTKGTFSSPIAIDSEGTALLTASKLSWRISSAFPQFMPRVYGSVFSSVLNVLSIKISGAELLPSVSGANAENTYQSIGAPSDLSLGMFPLQTLATTMTATINDCSVSVSGDVLHEQLLLSQTRDSLEQRTCASKYDVYAWSVDDARATNGAIQAYDGARDSDIPNGAAPIVFVNPSTGKEFNQFDAYSFTVPSTGTVVTVPVINYRPAFIPYTSNLVGQAIPSSTLPGGQWIIKPTNALVPVPVMFRFQSTEPLCLSPFLWQDSKQMSEVGLYGITNMTINLTLASPGPVVGYDKGTVGTVTGSQGRLYMDKLSNAYGSYNYMTRQSGINALFGNMRLQPPTANIGNQTGPWVTPPRLLCTFLTPPPEITLPLVSSVPYVEFPRYNSSATAAWGVNGTVSVQSSTVTLSSIPDLLVVFVRPAYRGQTQCDTYIPISNIGVTFDNYANLCSNFSQEDLYACSVAGGLDMDYNQFRGYARGRFPTLVPFSSGVQGGLFDTYKATSGNVQLTGAPIVLRMGQDIPLSSGLAPGTLGNYSVQVNLTLDNTNGFFNYLNTGGLATANNVIITVMGVNSGFFESVRGSSALRKTILNTNDVEAASTSSSVTSSQLVRLVGAGSGMHTSSRLTSSLGMPQFKPAVGEEQRIRKMPRTGGSYIP